MGHNVTLYLCAAALVLGVIKAKTPYDCDFEKDLCGWIAKKENYRHFWARGQGGNPTFGTGPTHDDSGRTTGHFLNLRVTKEKVSYKAWLTSPSMKSYATSSNCKLHFSYSLHVENPVHCENNLGTGCDRFSSNPAIAKQVCDVTNTKYYGYMKQNCAKVCGIHCSKLSVIASGTSRQQVFTVDFTKNVQWVKQTVPIPATFTGNFMEIIFEATTGGDINSFTSLDNIYFTGCHVTPPTTVPPTTTPTTTTTTPTTTTTVPTTIARHLIKPDMYDCHFESGTMCGFTSQSKTWKWAINSQGTPATGTGPPEDGSNSLTGHYALMRVSKSRIVDTARLISPLIDQFKYSPNCQLSFRINIFSPSFYYCTNQDGSACDKYKAFADATCEGYTSWANNQCSKLCGIKCTNFKVYVTNDMTNLGKTAYHIRTPRTDKWFTGTVPIGNMTKTNFRVVFEGLSGYDADSYIALDDIKFTRCDTKIPPVTTTTAAPTTTTPTTTPTTTTPTTTPTTTTPTTTTVTTTNLPSTAPPTTALPSTAASSTSPSPTTQSTQALSTETVSSAPPAPPPANVAVGKPKVPTTAASISIPIPAEQQSSKEKKDPNVLGIALGVAAAVVAAVAIIAIATYFIRKKNTAERSPSVSPLKEAWK